MSGFCRRSRFFFYKIPAGLQRQFSIVEDALDKCGLAVNARKCVSIRIDVHGRRKIWACNPHDFVKSRSGDLVKALSILDGYRYLGNMVSAGTASDTTLCKLRDGTQQLTKGSAQARAKNDYLEMQHGPEFSAHGGARQNVPTHARLHG